MTVKIDEPRDVRTRKISEVKIRKQVYRNLWRQSYSGVFAFEPNNRHSVSQRKTQEAYTKMGWRYHYIPYGVSHHDGQLIFYRNQDRGQGSENEEYGFATTLLGSPEAAVKITVNVLDLSAWLEKHVFNRTIPPRNSYEPPVPIVAMKMDVEGSEYRTLYHMDQQGTACKMDYILGELHLDELPQVFGPHNLTTKGQARKYGKFMKRTLFRKGCPGFWDFDDEEYLHDGMPYPGEEENERQQ